jgi:hypothetical protein
MDTNLGQNFESSYLHNKLDNPTFLNLVDVWTHCTFNPVNLLLNSKCIYGDMAAMTLLCSYFEVIESFRSGENSQNRAREFFINGFRIVFDKISTNTDIEAAAKLIYSQIRCGLSHEGMTREKVNFIRTGNAFLLTCSKNSDGSLNFKDVKSILLNPLRVRDATQNHCKTYITTLRESKDKGLCDAFEKTAKRLFAVGSGENIIGMREQEFLAQV